MQFTPEEKTKLKAMMLFLVKKKHMESAGNCGFQINELQPFLDELEHEGSIKLRPTINSNHYFLKTNHEKTRD